MDSVMDNITLAMSRMTINDESIADIDMLAHETQGAFVQLFASLSPEVRYLIYGHVAGSRRHVVDITAANSLSPEENLLSVPSLSQEYCEIYKVARQQYWAKTRFHIDLDTGSARESLAAIDNGCRNQISKPYIGHSSFTLNSQRIRLLLTKFRSTARFWQVAWEYSPAGNAADPHKIESRGTATSFCVVRPVFDLPSPSLLGGFKISLAECPSELLENLRFLVEMANLVRANAPNSS